MELKGEELWKQIAQPVASGESENEEEKEDPALIKWEMEWWRKEEEVSIII